MFFLYDFLDLIIKISPLDYDTLSYHNDPASISSEPQVTEKIGNSLSDTPATISTEKMATNKKTDTPSSNLLLDIYKSASKRASQKTSKTTGLTKPTGHLRLRKLLKLYTKEVPSGDVSEFIQPVPMVAMVASSEAPSPMEPTSDAETTPPSSRELAPSLKETTPSSPEELTSPLSMLREDTTSEYEDEIGMYNDMHVLMMSWKEATFSSTNQSNRSVSKSSVHVIIHLPIRMQGNNVTQVLTYPSINQSGRSLSLCTLYRTYVCIHQPIRMHGNSVSIYVIIHLTFRLHNVDMATGIHVYIHITIDQSERVVTRYQPIRSSRVIRSSDNHKSDHKVTGHKHFKNYNTKLMCRSLHHASSLCTHLFLLKSCCVLLHFLDDVIDNILYMKSSMFVPGQLYKQMYS